EERAGCSKSSRLPKALTVGIHADESTERHIEEPRTQHHHQASDVLAERNHAGDNSDDVGRDAACADGDGAAEQFVAFVNGPKSSGSRDGGDQDVHYKGGGG